MPFSVDDAEKLRAVIESRVCDIYSALTGIVSAFYPSTCTADIQLTTNRTLPVSDDVEDDVDETLPLLPGVRVLYFQAAAGRIRAPLIAGDPVLVVVLALDDANWRQTGVVPSNAVDAGRHHLKACVCIPGVSLDSAVVPLAITDGIEIVAPTGPIVIQASASNLVLQAQGAGAEARIDSTSVRLGTDNHADTHDVPVALATLVNTELGKIHTTLGTLTGGGASFGTPYIPATVAATRVTAR